MFLLYDTALKKRLLDENGDLIQFHYEHTAQEYYWSYCSNMTNVTILELTEDSKKVFPQPFYEKN